MIPLRSPSAFDDRLPERDADVLRRVMQVDVGVALGAHRQVDQRMARELLQHVVEEADACLHVIAAGPVEIDGDGDPRFGGLAGDFCLAHGLAFQMRRAFTSATMQRPPARGASTRGQCDHAERMIMITGMHAVIYTRDAEADRAFFRDILGLQSVDAGGGWLIFAVPPSEVALHPAEANGRHELFLLCDDVKAEVGRLSAKGVTCGKVSDEGWGLLTAIKLPGGGSLGLYEPRHPNPHAR